MLLVSAHVVLGLVIAIIVAAFLAVIGVPALVAVGGGALAGWVLVQTVFRDVADRIETWLTTPR